MLKNLKYIWIKTLFFGFLAIFSNAQAQNFPFIKKSENQLFFPDQNCMKHFFSALDALESKDKKRKVNIVHIGDSHIQADIFSGRVRELFQQNNRFSSGGRGFVFPYEAAKTNNPHNYHSSYTGTWEGKRSIKADSFSRWGLAGITAVTYDEKSTITIDSKEKQEELKISKIKIFYPVFDPASFTVSIATKSKNLLSIYSSKSGFVEYAFKEPQKSVTLTFNKMTKKQRQFVLQGMVLENEDQGILYHAVGTNGAKVQTYFRCEDFDRHLKVLNADLVIISLGTNDAHSPIFNEESYKTDLRQMVADIRKVSPKSSILITTCGDSYRGNKHNAAPAKVREQIFELAKEMKVAVWDFYNVMGGTKSIDKWLKSNLAQKDKVHLTPKGYTIQGDLLYEAIEKAYKNFKKD
ncbi:MAG: hypothetical protein EAZ97_03550 [Bacteroidetes bacterium]|nr:MAG: hypothetical protein EAZ97_03550 [Bacteroidota bacterium]